MDGICKYSNCERPINSFYSSDYCLFHSDVDMKGTVADIFYERLFRDMIHNDKYEFIGIKFPTPFKLFDFKQFLSKDIIFLECEFGDKNNNIETKTVFNNVVANKELVFSRCKFFNKTEFINCDFRGRFELNHIYFFQNLFFEKSFFNAIKFRDITCEEDFYIKEGGFNKGLDFNGTKIKSDLVIDVTIHKKLTLFNSLIRNKLLLARNKVEYDFEISNCEIGLLLAFNNDFQNFEIDNKTNIKKLNLSKGTFNQKVQINDSYLGLSNFHGSVFKEGVFIFNSSFANTDFSGCQFDNEFLCNKNKFIGNTDFNWAIFKSSADFTQVEILKEEEKTTGLTEIGIAFNRTQFKGAIFFTDCIISHQISFNRILQNSETIFRLNNPTFENGGRIVFENIRFEPFTTYIENIRKRMNNVNPIVLFRYCNLKDVYFTNNDMSYISLHKCVYDEARFYLSKWSDQEERFAFFKYKRKNFIFEDLYRLGEFKNIDLTKYIKPGELDDYSEIASLYRRFKTSLDGTKDYEQAGWFYFNEFEMKLRATKPSKLRSRKTPKYFLYYLYKLFTGYGEKPLWSFLWFLFFIMTFSFINFFNGFKINGNQILNYDLNLNGSFLNWEIIKDFGVSIFYTIYRIIPINYIPLEKGYFAPLDTWGIIISLLNSIILIFFLTFIFIGLKRLFRRF